MKCPDCGKEIPDGSLFCENCAAEIKMVPEYEAKLEEQISSGMKSVTRVFEEHRVFRNKRRKIKLLLVFLVGAVSAVALLILVWLSFLRQKNWDVSYYVGRAYQFASEERYEEAADAIDSAIATLEESEEWDASSAADLYLLKSDYLLDAGYKDLALGAASMILDLDNLTQEDEIAAYGQMIGIYASYEEYDSIAELLENCTLKSVVDAYPQYAIQEPVFSQEEGEYQDSLLLELSAGGDGSIFYTLDGSEPDLTSLLYKGPIELSEGTYEVSAIYVNHFGLQSSAVTRTYTIVSSVPDPPEISPNSGTYAKQQQIVAEYAGHSQPAEEEGGAGAQEEEEQQGDRSGVGIYYTTDGTDPTLESTEYTGPIAMPEGTTVYRFAVITDDGISSEVVEREYTFKLTSLLSEEDGVNYILVALIRRGEIVDTIGTVPGGTARYSFTYTGIEQISASGNFLIYSESLVDDAGNEAATGRVYAVNATNGTVNLYADGVLTPIG